MTIPCSAILITHQYNAQCKRAINSLRHFNEIVIYSNNSGISSKESLPTQARVITLPTEPITDFAAIRNRALQEITHDWAFFLDSDEELQPFSARALTHLLATTSAHGFVCTRSDFFLDKKLHYGEAGNQKIIRLVHRAHTQFVGKIHEVANVQGSVRSCDLNIHHFSHASISEFIRDVTVYASNIGLQKKFSLFELLVFPPAKFFSSFFVKRGFLDGYRGLVYALIMSLHSLTVRATAYEKNHH